MTSGTAVFERWGCRAEELGRQTDAATSLVAWYLAEGIASLCSVIPVDVVIIGGGMAKLPGLHDEVTAHLRGASGNYPPVPFAESGPVIVPPGLGDDAGVLGAIEIARMASRAGEDG
jgi:fructokinase